MYLMYIRFGKMGVSLAMWCVRFVSNALVGNHVFFAYIVLWIFIGFCFSWLFWDR